MENAGDERRAGVEELEVGFEVIIVGGRGGCCGPQNWVVVREEGEDNSEEEACRCYQVLAVNVAFSVVWFSARLRWD